jgi:hypothetical integral membrane protein (TIGR02206 family)
MTPPTFHAFHTQHLVTLTIIVAVCILIAWKARSNNGPRWLRWLLGVALLGHAAVFYIQLGINHALALEYSLPLDLCDLVLIASIIALFHPNQFMTEIVYFLGFGGVLQATLTPDLSRGFPSWDFILFFWSHGITLMAIVFLISRPGFKPRGGSIVRMMVAVNIYALVAGTIDAITGWNYGYLCRKPSEASLIDFLGPWPWYLLSLELIALVIFLILDLPWILSGRLEKRQKSALSRREPT